MTAVEKIAALRAVHEAASPGKWQVTLAAPCSVQVSQVGGWVVAHTGDEMQRYSGEDAHAIVSAHNALPALLKALEDVLALTYASDDGSEYSHHGHSPILGEPECPACWADSIRTAIEAALAEVDHG